MSSGPLPKPAAGLGVDACMTHSSSRIRADAAPLRVKRMPCGPSASTRGPRHLRSGCVWSHCQNPHRSQRPTSSSRSRRPPPSSGHGRVCWRVESSCECLADGVLPHQPDAPSTRLLWSRVRWFAPSALRLSPCGFAVGVGALAHRRFFFQRPAPKRQLRAPSSSNP